MLTGEGADELFGGYQTYVADRLGGRARAWRPRRSRRAVARCPSSSGRLQPRLPRAPPGARRRARAARAPPRVQGDVRRGARADLLGWSGDPLASLRARYAETEGAEPIARLQDVDVGTFLADDLLPQADRAGMAHGLEIRVPFLDPVVAELALALPVDARVRGLETKRVLRAAAAPLLPASVVRGPKRGFCAPAAAWLRGPLEELARDVLSPARVARQGLFAPAPVTALLDRHVARREDLSRPLWALLAFTLWHDAWSTAPVPVPRPAILQGGGVTSGAVLRAPTMRRVASCAAVLALGLGGAARRRRTPRRPDGRRSTGCPNEEWVNLLWLPYDEDAPVRRCSGSRAARCSAGCAIDAAHARRSSASAAAGRRPAGRRARRAAPRQACRRRAAPRRSRAAPSARSRRATSRSTCSSTRCTRRRSPSARRRSSARTAARSSCDLRRAELSPLQIGELHGRTRVELHRGVARTPARRGGARRQRRLLTPAPGAACMLDRQLRQLPRWLGQRRYNGPSGGAQPAATCRPATRAKRPSISADG